jgi:hypothetical protein
MHRPGSNSVPIALLLAGASLGATFFMRLRRETQPRVHDADKEDVRAVGAKAAQQVTRSKQHLAPWWALLFRPGTLKHVAQQAGQTRLSLPCAEE